MAKVVNNTTKKGRTVPKKGVKGAYEDWSSGLKEAFYQGYRAGYETHDDIPKVTGSRTAAQVGFNRGMGDRKQVVKGKNRYQKAKKTTGAENKPKSW